MSTLSNYEDDDIAFEDSEDRQEDENNLDIPPEERILRTQPYDKSVNDLVNMVKDEDIFLNPHYQRKYIWENKKASLLIESILLNVPIPVIYVAEDQDSVWNVVDGLQRLNSLVRFFNNEFKLTGLEVLSELNKKQFSTLNSKAQRVLKNGIIRVIVILQESHPEIKYDIFLRLNRGAIKLKEQELRNCLYQGKFNNALCDMAKTTSFLKLLDLKEPHKRFDDVELALRFFAIRENLAEDSEGKFHVKNYQGKMKSFLNSFMDSKKSITNAESLNYTKEFESTLNLTYTVLGDNAFKKIKPNDQPEGRINRALMDVILVSFNYFDHKAIIEKKEEILLLHRQLPNIDSEFNNSILLGTSDKQKLNYRLNKWLSEMKRILANESKI